MQRSKDSMSTDLQKKTFGERLRFFAKLYGYKEDKIEALVERSSKNLPMRQSEPGLSDHPIELMNMSDDELQQNSQKEVLPTAPKTSTKTTEDIRSVYVNIRMRKHLQFKIKKVDTNFPKKFKKKYKNYILNIFGDDYEIIGIKGTLCELNKPINFEKYSKNTKNCLNNNRIMKPAFLKRKQT